MSTKPPPKQPSHRISKPHHKKLPRLPQNARISKRPLLHPAIPSPHSGRTQPKVIYISSRTAFIPVVKRVEKLLHLAEKREIQSATTVVKNSHHTNKYSGAGKRRRGGGVGSRGRDGEPDEVLEIAETVERQKQIDTQSRGGDVVGEEVVLKGTGKAVQKVLELALWFQQREDRFMVRLQTGSVGAIDDIEVREPAEDDQEEFAVGDEGVEDSTKAGVVKQVEQAMDIDIDEVPQESGTHESDPRKTSTLKEDANSPEPIPETRIRYTSSLEVSVRGR